MISKIDSAKDWKTANILEGRDSQIIDLEKKTSLALFNAYQVMSVWGIAGVGKSSLIKRLFCERILNKHQVNELYGWVEVSHPFNLRDLSRSLLLSLQSESVQATEASYCNNMGCKNPIVQCREKLKQHMCLVVIDGLQCTKEWDMIQTDLVSGAHRRTLFIIITNEQKIARHCRGDKGEFVLNVKGLEPEYAFKLFAQVCFSLNLSLFF